MATLRDQLRSKQKASGANIKLIEKQRIISNMTKYWSRIKPILKNAAEQGHGSMVLGDWNNIHIYKPGTEEYHQIFLSCLAEDLTLEYKPFKRFKHGRLYIIRWSPGSELMLPRSYFVPEIK